MKLFKNNTIEILVSIIIVLTCILLLVLSDKIQNQIIKTICQTTFSFIAISLLLSYAYSAIQKKHDHAKLTFDLKNIINEFYSEVSIISGFNFAKYGLKTIDDTIDFNKIFNKLDSNDSLFWLNTYAPNYRGWIDSLENAIKRGANINILAINPNCPNTSHRASELDSTFTLDTFQSEINIFINVLTKKKNEFEVKNFKGKLNVKIYDDLLCVPIYLILRNNIPLECYSSFFLDKPTSYGFPHFKWVNGTESLINNFHTYLLEKWNRKS